MNTARRCPGCGVHPGDWHKRGCEIEQCPYCGGQAILCDEDDDLIPLDDRLPWTGSWPGEVEAIQFGWYCIRGPQGWQACRKGEAQAIPDLDRLRRDALWDRDKKCFVKRPGKRPRTL